MVQVLVVGLGGFLGAVARYKLGGWVAQRFIFAAFTTFSAFSFETIFLLRRGESAQALVSVGLHVVLCLFFTWVALRLGERLF